MYSPIGVPLALLIVPVGPNTPLVSLRYTTNLKSRVNALYTVADPPDVSITSPSTGGSVNGSTSRTESTFSTITCSPDIKFAVGSVYCPATFWLLIPFGNNSTDTEGPVFLLKLVNAFHLSTSLS